jgi:outer membrane receptor protein involved in Fe transport
MRLRYAYGQSGVQPGPNDALRFYSSGIDEHRVLGSADHHAGGVRQPDPQARALGRTRDGLRDQMLDSRLSLDFTYYSKITTDALISAVLPPSFGSVTSQLRNLGSVKNAGVEASITAQLLQRDVLGWDIVLAGSANDNKVVSLGDTPPQIGTTNAHRGGLPDSGALGAPDHRLGRQERRWAAHVLCGPGTQRGLRG